jgi:phage baseplate assembly protein W
MAVSRAFSIEDGNLSSRPITVARELTYSDIDLTFTPKPSGDLYKKVDAADVKQSVKNLLLTNYTEKPFNMRFGGNLSDFLFELETDTDIDILADQIIEAVDLYEPRAQVLRVYGNIKPDNNEVRVTVEFQVLSTSELVVLDLTLTRLR